MGEARRKWAATDPRPDLVEDTGLWVRLLTLAYDVDGDKDGLACALNGFRALGARLGVRDGSARLLPGDVEEYDALRGRWLLPHRRTLTALLRRVAEGSGRLVA